MQKIEVYEPYMVKIDRDVQPNEHIDLSLEAEMKCEIFLVGGTQQIESLDWEHDGAGVIWKTENMLFPNDLLYIRPYRIVGW